MDRFTFNTFVVKNGNREASDLCLAVANLQPVKPQPLLLLGDSGAGKTHLLCAIVNHIKEHAPRTALAYVTAKDFPMAVRALAEDAGPVTRAHSAVLLVDQFEKLPPGMLDHLARIAPLFLEDNRYLVIAAQTAPKNLPGVPAPLLELVQAGRVASLEKVAPPAEAERVAADSSRQAQDEIQQARQDAKDAHDELVRWALRAQAILQQVELNRARFAENAELQIQRVLALQQQLKELTAPKPNEPAGQPLAADPEDAADIAPQRPWYAEAFPLPPNDPSQGPQP
jgi:chromosomal replication initiation ATPase DnaA